MWLPARDGGVFVLQKAVCLTGSLPMNRDRVIRLVTAASSFRANVLLERKGATINGKSMLGLLSISESTGREFMLVVSGADEAEALERLAAMLEESQP